MAKSKKLVIFGDSAFAEVAYEYFTHDSQYEVAAFAVNKEYLRKDALFGVPVVAYEDLERTHPPSDYEAHVALVYNRLNRTRMAFYRSLKSKGYRLATYVSSRAFVWRGVEIGDNCFVFENNVLQPFARIGSDVVLWSGNHIGHHSTIGSHCFVSSHVVVSGFVNVGESCFFGVNSSVANNVNVGADCLIGAGSLIVKDLKAGSLTKGAASSPDALSTYEKFGIDPNE